MPGKRCNVASCNNSVRKTKQCPETRHIMYHKFPNDPESRKRWIHLCRRGGKWNPDTCAICSEHFVPEDYETDLRSEFLNLPPKKRLKNSAVPSRRLRAGNRGKIDDNVVSRRNRKDRRDQRKLVREILLKDDRDIETESRSKLLTTNRGCVAPPIAGRGRGLVVKKVDGGAMKDDAFLKAFPSLPCVIRMNLEHSHPGSDMDESLRMWEPIKCENLQVSVDPKICSLVQNNRQQSDLISEAQQPDSEDQIIHTSIIKIEPVSDEEIAEENSGTSESSNDMLNSSQLAIDTILVKEEVEDGS